jgi:hypothetical protein
MMPLIVFFMGLLFWATVATVASALHDVLLLGAAVVGIFQSISHSLQTATRFVGCRFHHAATR